MIAAWDGDPRSRSGSGEVVAGGDESPLPASLFSGSTRRSVAAASLRDGMGSVHYRMQAAKKKVNAEEEEVHRPSSLVPGPESSAMEARRGGRGGG